MPRRGHRQAVRGRRGAPRRVDVKHGSATRIASAPTLPGRFVDIVTLSGAGTVVDIAATSDECAALAANLSLAQVGALRARVWLRRWGGDGARVRVRLSADVVQSCVVTLDPVRSRIGESFELAFPPTGEGLPCARRQREAEPAEETSGPVLEGTIDLGGVIAECLSLAIDPYPRKPGAELRGEWEGAGSSDEPEGGPFAALRAWRGKA